MLDTLIKGGTVVDGTCSDGFTADVGLRGGRIVAVGRIDESARNTIDAGGLHVLPGFVDIHTHYDGQVSWDPTFTPSIFHGVTTLVMGNCGVGFAPVRPTDHDVLIDLMEGVEEIPGTALSEGITWGWESFTDYARVLDRMPHSLDFMTLVPHDTLRLYVMGERAANGEQATADDLAQMRSLLRQALIDGAAGLAVGSTQGHRTAKGRWTPSFEVAESELVALASVLRGLPYRVLQGVHDFAAERGAPEAEEQRFQHEYGKLEAMAKAAGRPLTLSWMDRIQAPRQATWLGQAALASAGRGVDVWPQCAPRAVGTLMGLDTSFTVFLGFPSYASIAHLPAAERAARMREPALRARVLAETAQKVAVEGTSVNPLIDFIIANLETVAFQFFPLVGDAQGRMDYEPHPDLSIGAQARRRGLSARELLYDYLAEGQGTNLVYFPVFNYRDGSLNRTYEMLQHPRALVGLGDGGAHVGTVCDASYSTTMLAHWGVQRTRGPRLPVPFLVHMLTQRNARFMGLHDRGVIAAGMKADVNLVDLGKLGLNLPTIVRDLPKGGRRMVQAAQGYVATWVSGEKVVDQGQITPARPGRWTHPTQTA